MAAAIALTTGERHELEALTRQSTAVRARGKEATIGFTENDEWLPLLKLGGGSGAFNVMSLFVREGRGWAPTFVRGTPVMLAVELLGPLRFTWAVATEESIRWQRSSDPPH